MPVQAILAGVPLAGASRRLRTYLPSPVSRFPGLAVSAGADLRIRWTTIGCMGLLAMIAGTVSYLHMHLLVARHGQPGWVAALTPLPVDEMIAAASTTLPADPRSGRKGGALAWALLVTGSVASLAARLAADPDAGRAHKQSSGGQYSPLWRQLLSPAMGASLSHAKDSDQRSL